MSGAVSSLLRHSLGRESWAGRWPWGRGRAKGKRSGRASVSTALTLTPNRACTPVKNRSIPTIPAGRFGGRLGNVSAVDTGQRRNESGVLAAQPGASVTGPPPPTPARRLRWGPVVRVRLRPHLESRPESARVGLLHEGRDPLAKGCAYCTKAPPAQSAPDPPPVAPHPRGVSGEPPQWGSYPMAPGRRQSRWRASCLRRVRPQSVSETSADRVRQVTPTTATDPVA